jgi:hypothetical protein
MAVGNVGFATRSQTSATSGFKKFLGRHFYFCMALLMAGLSVWGFRQTVDARLLHAKPPRPLLLWFHGAAFSAWIVLFIAQSALAAAMVASSFSVSVVMVRFDRTALGKDLSSFLSVLWCDMIIFGACMALAIYFRKLPEYHRRLVFMASCQLMQAAFVRFPYIGYRDLSFPALDVLIVAGMLRDLVVDGRVNRVYLYILPPMIVLQSWATYLARVNPSCWQAATHAILGW